MGCRSGGLRWREPEEMRRRKEEERKSAKPRRVDKEVRAGVQTEERIPTEGVTRRLKEESDSMPMGVALCEGRSAGTVGLLLLLLFWLLLLLLLLLL